MNWKVRYLSLRAINFCSLRNLRNLKMTLGWPINKKKILSQSLFPEKRPACLYLRLSFHQTRVSKKILNNILEIRRPFWLQSIGWWLWILLGTNILKLHSRGSMMLALMAGREVTFIGVAISKTGLWQSSRQLKTSSLAASLQQTGRPQLSSSPTPTRSCSVSMRAANTLLFKERLRQSDATRVTVHCLAQTRRGT
jgi:hypothetical protein